jgi:glucan phosphoethanolaminetransferase (alkaline phosphatase superfamily)
LKSIPFLITRVSVDSLSEHLKEKSIMAAFKEAGFYTAWISNQYDANKSVTSEFHMLDVDTTIFTNRLISGDKSFMMPGLYDELLVAPLTNLINTTSKDLFIVIHTMGSHWKYKLRFPSEYNIFKSDKDSDDAENELIDDYDNSILYTDYILDMLINKLKATRAVTSLVYVADHGENLNDNANGLMYHSATPTLYTAHVPLFIWTYQIV